ncbi:MAG: membrane protein insertion efficiency factor YidD [Rhodanobacteraceae bacterium]
MLADPPLHAIAVSRPIILLLALYKRWLSPVFGPRCRFHPSCSDYARVAIARFGAARGGWLACRRVLRCQPLCAGGDDPVPQAFHWLAHARNGNIHD